MELRKVDGTMKNSPISPIVYPKGFHENAVLKNFVKFTGNNWQWSLPFSKAASLAT